MVRRFLSLMLWGRWYVPVDRVFFETDESPLPIAATYATAAAITGKTVAEWKETVYDNYRRLFKTP